ncbi:MAG: hypothetical protein E7407_00035 [Ruminococcaceae bacterium]|nr:hypothetical protein [Oscillospiraceae bacterium]
MVKLTRKLTVLFLVFLVIFAISGCSGLKVVKEIASVDGRIISEGEFKYYLENIKTQMLTEAGLSSEEEIESFWAGDINGDKATDVAKNKALDEVIRVEIANILAEEANISVDSSRVSSYREMFKQGGDQIDELKTKTGLNDEDLIKLIIKEETASLYAGYLSSEQAEKFTPAKEDVIAKYESEYVRVKHIFVSRTDMDAETTEAEETAEPAKTPEEIENAQKFLIAEAYQKVTSGADFEALINEYNEDPGMEQQPDGYTFTKNSGMVKPFEDAAFALEIGQTSEIVEQTQGWHILKRYPLLSSGEEYNQYISAVTNEMSTDIFNKYIDSLKANYTILIK